jgi:hypothetical protein
METLERTRKGDKALSSRKRVSLVVMLLLRKKVVGTAHHLTRVQIFSPLEAQLNNLKANHSQVSQILRILKRNLLFLREIEGRKGLCSRVKYTSLRMSLIAVLFHLKKVEGFKTTYGRE